MASILLVDDSSTIRSVLRIYLMARKDQFTEAESGERGLELAHSRSFDLIIADYNMGAVDGVELVRRLRGGGANRTTPVILLTTERAESLRQEALAAGANAFLTKPVKAPELLEVMNRLAVA